MLGLSEKVDEAAEIHTKSYLITAWGRRNKILKEIKEQVEEGDDLQAIVSSLGEQQGGHHGDAVLAPRTTFHRAHRPAHCGP